MKEYDKKLVLVFVTLLIIIMGTFAATIYYYETRYPSRGVEGTSFFVKAFADETIGAAPLDVNFSSLLLDLEGTPTYHWEFGDGETSNQTNPAHNYTEEGEYVCNLTVIDSTGKNVTTSVKILVVANGAPTVIALVTPTGSNRPDKLFLYTKLPDQIIVNILKKGTSSVTKTPGNVKGEAQTTDPEGDEIVLYKWELLQPPTTTIFGSTEYPTKSWEGEDLKNFTFPELYTFRTGRYDVKVTVTDSAGNTASNIVSFNIGNSNLENQIRNLRYTWSNLWGANFNYLPQNRQDRLIKIWLILGPMQTATNNMVEKILSPLPENVSSGIYSLYYTLIWEKIDTNYHKPNYNPPSTPSNPSPADNATDISLDADLIWNCSDLDGHPLSYDIYFGTTSPPPLVYSGQGGAATTFELGPLQPDTTYYWKIVVRDHPRTGKSVTVTSPIWSFTTD